MFRKTSGHASKIIAITNNRTGGGYGYTYDAAGRMASLTINGVLQAEYKYDFAGRQAVRRLQQLGVTLHSVFASDGRRIAEYNEATGALVREYVWMDWSPVTVIEGAVVSFVRSDHIGRPVFATNAAGTKVWTASYLPFGGVRTTTGSPMTARFPGQWFQSESGLHQNWMRDYDPTTGRYLQADPLGLVDGASVYGYAHQSPIIYADPRGGDATRWLNTEGGRPFNEGPTNGNWGGGCWSGGQFSCGPDGVGNAPATDSADECYLRHDNCYAVCGDNGACMTVCDRTLADELRALPEDPTQWLRPPTPGTEEDTRLFRQGAIGLFGGNE
jgi:RHS repeat-associated protein